MPLLHMQLLLYTDSCCCFCYHKNLWMSDCMSNGLQYLRKRGRSACIIPPGYNVSASAEDQHYT